MLQDSLQYGSQGLELKDRPNPDWQRLLDLTERVYRRGFDEGRTLIRAEHEIRGLDTLSLGSDRILVLAGDKLGCWHAGIFNLKNEESEQALSPVPIRGGWVVDQIRFICLQDRHFGVLGTRGGGAWLVPVDLLLEGKRVSERDLTQLPGTEDREIQRLLCDPTSETLWAASGRNLMRWSLAGSEPELLSDHDFGFRITALAIDRGPADDGLHDDFYIATNSMTLHRVRRRKDGSFPSSRENLEKEHLWQGRLSVIEHLHPLSEITCRSEDGWHRVYPHRGVIAATLRHLLLIHDDESHSKAPYCQSRLVVARSKILSVFVINLPDWQGLAVSTLEGKLRIYRPSGVRAPTDAYDCSMASAPETRHPTTLLSGYDELPHLGRVYGGIALEPRDGQLGKEVSVVFARGDNRVELRRFMPRWDLRRQARQVAARITAGTSSVGELLLELQQFALQSRDVRREKNALIQLLPELGPRCASFEQWRAFLLLVWDLLGTSRNLPSVPLNVIQALRALQAEMAVEEKERRQDLEDTIFKIRKYVLDRQSFSGKETHFLTLQASRDPGLADDRAIYRSILIARRVDPLFVEDYSRLGFGEIQHFSRVPWPSADFGGERFLAATYGGRLWLLDDRGRAVNLKGNSEEWGGVTGCYFQRDRLVLSFEQCPMKSVPRSAFAQAREGANELTFEVLPGSRDGMAGATAFCPLPGQEEGEGTDFLFGDREGGIHLFSESKHVTLVDSGTVSRHLSRAETAGAAIQQLATFQAVGNDGSPLDVVAVATAEGRLLAYRWCRNTIPSLEFIDLAQVTSQPLTALLVLGESQRRLIVGTADGRVMGYRLVFTNTSRGERMHLALGWSLKADATVRSIRRLDPSLPVDGDVRSRLILAGSHDQNLYLLDVEGRHIEIFSLRNFKVDLFVTLPAGSAEDVIAATSDGSIVESRVFACAFEERFVGLSLINRPRLIGKFNEESLPAEGEDREIALTRWRAYSLQEGHLRHRFLLQSQRYPGSAPRTVIKAIHNLIRTSDIETTEDLTGEVTALLRRLFQLYPPGEVKRTPSGLATILEDPELYLETLRLLRELEERWDTPGSVRNRRVRLFWVRSFLRSMTTVEMFHRWFACGRELQDRETLAAPGRLLEHFLEGPSSRVQLKTLQYLERLLFGWPGVTRRGLLEDVNRAELREPVDELLGTVYHRIGRSLGSGVPLPADSVLLQACRLLSLMLCHGHLDPLFLGYQIEVKRLPQEIYSVLRDQLVTLTDTSPGGHSEATETKVIVRVRALEAARVLELAEDLRSSARDPSLPALEALIDHCRRAREENPDEAYCREAKLYYETLMPLLQVTCLEDLRNLAAEWRPPESSAGQFYSSFRYLEDLGAFLEAVRQYWYQKHNDLISTPLEAITYGDFDRVRRQWQKVHDTLTQPQVAPSQQERALIDQLLASWQKVVDEEQQIYLLRDFSSAIGDYFKPVAEVKPGSEEALALKKQEEERALAAFANLFIRLLLFAEPAEGVYLYRWRQGRSDEVRGKWFHTNDDDTEAYVEEIGTDIHPDWIDSSWLDPASFSSLDEETLRTSLRDKWPEHCWRVNSIAGGTERDQTFGLYIFLWFHSDSTGCKRFDDLRLAWSMPLEAMVYRRAALEQELLKGHLFSTIAHELRGPIHLLRSDLGTLVDGFLEEQQLEKRFDKYRQLLRAARRLDGIVQGVLSIQGRTVTVVKTHFSLAKMLYELVRTARKEATDRGISIEFLKPTQEQEAATTIKSDEVKIYDIVSNLVTNAVKYSPRATQIKLGYTVTIHGAEVRVEDQGPGITQDEMPYLFDLYFRGTMPRAKEIPGLGMGLYTARLYANALGGRIHAQNRPEGGAAFILFLPDIGVSESENLSLSDRKLTGGS